VFDGLIKLAKPGSKLVHDGQHPDEAHLGTLPSCAVRVMNDDPTELKNLAKSNPAKLKEMQALFDKEAKANQFYPLINWSDLFPGFIEFQRKMGLSPSAGSPKK
jgi:hypothetical protein